MNNSSVLASARSSVKIKWHHNRLEEYSGRLEKLQGSLALATTLSLRTRNAGNHNEILEHLKSIKERNDTSQESRDEVIMVLRVLQGLAQQQSGPKLDQLQVQMDSCMRDIEQIRSSITDTREEKILRWLDFRQRTWRFEEVEEAHRNTFNWIYRKPEATTPWHDFSAHLSGASVSLPYFIRGKAGSGKSTLMKFIVSNGQTKTELRKWAGQHKLLTPHFFFWNVGTKLQKSHTGMLRSLLHTILAQYHDLIPAVFPTLYADDRMPPSDDDPPSYVELKGALERLKTRSASFLRICIFIDGIDEFEGDHRDMSTFLNSIASSAIKVVVSSRPINACLNVFAQCPTLKLEDLTYNDMSVFIQERLTSHPMMEDLQTDSPEKASILKAEIQEKAEGVFLWVRIVTGLILRGLEDGDDFDDLLPVLRSLPSDLRELYARMIQKMTPAYQVQASRMFQIFEWWRLRGDDRPLELLLLAFAIPPPSTALSLPTELWTATVHERFTKRMVARIRSRCCGLLEVRGLPSSGMFWPPTPVVTYLHHSVAEFLTSQDVWDDMIALNADTNFNPGTNIAFGILSIMKTGLIYPRLDFERAPDQTNPIEILLDIAIDGCRQNVAAEVILHLKFMEGLDRAMTVIFQRSGLHSNDQPDAKLSAHWAAKLSPSCFHSDSLAHPNQDPLCTQVSIRSFAAYTGYHPYLKAVNRYSTLVDVELLILFALGSWMDRRYIFPVRRETLWYLLQVLDERSELGIESPIESGTLWEHAMGVVHDGSIRNRTLVDSAIMKPLNVCVFGEVSGFPHLDSNDTGESWRPSGAGEYPWNRVRKLENQEVYPVPTDKQTTSYESLSQVKTFLDDIREQPSKATVESSRLRDAGSVQRKNEFNASKATRERPEKARHRYKGTSSHQPIEPPQPRPNRIVRDKVLISETQEVVGILRLFLSFAKDPRKLLNQDIKTFRRSTVKPLLILRKALTQGREEPHGWVLRPEYDFLHELVGLK